MDARLLNAACDVFVINLKYVGDPTTISRLQLLPQHVD